jgi:phytol kinase
MNAMLRREIGRKGIHLSCTVFPLLYLFWMRKEQIIVLSCLITGGFITSEILRFKSVWVKNLFKQIFTSLLREGEKENAITGATYLFMGMTIAFIIFSKTIAVASILILTVADSLAAIIGKYFGNKRFLHKTWLGSLTFYGCTAAILVIILPELSYWTLLLAFPITILEAWELPINDNIMIPLLSGVLLLVASRFPF